MLAKAIFAAGCFWGVQAVFDNVPGVIATRVGYIGGVIQNPTYRQVCTGITGHAEAVEITYNPNMVSYSQLLDVFFASHNPTTPNRQGGDVGTQYRSAVFYLNDEQKQTAALKIEEENLSGRWKNPVVTELLPAKSFYQAEDYHQNYLKKQEKGAWMPRGK